MTEKKLSTEALNLDQYPSWALVRIKTAAELSARCRQTIYRDIKKGLLEQVLIGGSVRIPVGSLRSYLAGMP